MEMYYILSILAFFVVGLPYSVLLFSKAGNRKSILEVFILTSTIGSLVINYVIFTLGYAGWLSREKMFLALFAIIFTPLLLGSVRSAFKHCCLLIRKEIHHIRTIKEFTLLEVFTLSLVASLLLITSYSAFARSPTLRDPYAVWLFYGKKIMETGTIPLFYGNAPDISWSGNYPPLISFLAGYYFIALGQAVPKAFTHVSWVYGILTLMVTFALARELESSKAAFISIFLITTSSLFTLELINYGYVTVAWSFYIAASCLYLVKYLREKTLYALLSFGLCLGASLLSTYLSFIFVASVLILMLAGALAKKTCKRMFFPECKPLIIGLILAFVIVLPWLTRNYVLLGNPVYPWLYELFGGKGINPVLIKIVPQPKYSLHQMLIDQTFVALSNQDIGYTLLVFGLVGSAHLIWSKNVQSPSYVGWLTLIFFTILLASMCLYYGYERYLLMVAPLLAVSAGHLLHRIFLSSKQMLKILVLASIITFSLPNYAHLMSLVPYGVPVGETKPLSYIQYYIDKYLPSNATLLTNEIQLYFINCKAVNIYNLPEVFQAKNLKDLINSLRFHNITHILINSNMAIEISENTLLISALTENDDLFKILLNIHPYILYKINYGEIHGYG